MEVAMIAQKISNLHQFTKQLFLEKTFDSFLVSELTISTYNSFHIDGRLKREFFTEEEWNKFEKWYEENKDKLKQDRTRKKKERGAR